MSQILFGVIVFAAILWGGTFRRLHLRLSHYQRDALLLAALLASATLLYWPMLNGHTLMRVDHNAHLLKVVEFENLLKNFQLFGWTDMEFAGYPHNIVYPFGGYLLTAAIHALPGVGLTMAYNTTVFVAILASMLSVAAAARIHFGRLAAFVAGIFALLDLGNSYEGGYDFMISEGVWPPSIATAMVLLAIALLSRALQRGTVSALAVPGILIGLGILFHPLAFVLAVVATPIFFLVVLKSDNRPALNTLLFRLGIVAAAAFAVCAFWLVPFIIIGHRGFIQRMPFWPLSSDEMWTRLVDGRLMGQPPLWMGATLVGLFLMARRRQTFARFIGFFVPVAIVFTTADFLELFHLLKKGDDSSPLLVLQLERIYFLIRPLGMIAAAFAIAQSVKSFPKPSRNFFVTLSRIVVAAAVMVAIMLPGARFPGWPKNPAPADLTATERVQLEAAFDVVARFLKPGERVALYDDRYSPTPW